MKKFKFECFLDNEEMAEIREYIKELLKDREVELYESGGLGVRPNWFKKCVIFEIYRIVGTATVKLPLKKSGSRSTKSKQKSKEGER